MPERAQRRGSFVRWLLVVLALACVADLAAAQGKRGKGKGKKGGKAPAAAPGVPEREMSFGGGTGGLPGFDTPSGGAKKGARGKAGAAAGKKPSPKKPAPAPPPDPRKEADLVTATADHRAEVDEAEQKLLREHFKVCDLDGNGWLSLRELEITLSLPRDDFRRADTNHDGRVVQEEFTAQKTVFFARLGAQPLPERKPEPKEPATTPTAEAPAPNPAPAKAKAAASAKARKNEGTGLETIFPRPSDLLNRYDGDKSKGMDVAEIERLLLEVGLELSAPQLLETMDTSKSAQLEAGELRGLSLRVSEHMPKTPVPQPAPEVEDSDGELVAAADEILAPAATPPSDELAPEPAKERRDGGASSMTHFGRLDKDDDGYIGEADLRALQNPARTDLSFTAVISVLDRDGDGKLDEREFNGSMMSSPR